MTENKRKKAKSGIKVDTGLFPTKDGDLMPYQGEPRYYTEPTEIPDISGPEYYAEHVLKTPLLPVGKQWVGILSSGEFDKVVGLWSRRSQKTTATQAFLLSECFDVPNTRVISTAQTGIIASNQQKELFWLLEAAYPDPDNRPFKINRGAAEMWVRWENGSMWKSAAPKPESFRSAAYDYVLFDEAGIYNPATSEALLEGALPVLDTTGGTLILTSTSPATREGLFWSYLQAARAGSEGFGILEYSASITDDWADPATWYKCHPGLACGLVPFKVVQDRFATMSLQSFAREYLSVEPQDSYTNAINPELWKETTVDDYLTPSSTSYVAFAAHPDRLGGAVAQAWLEDGRPVVQLLEARPDINWMPKYIEKLIRDNPQVEIVFDGIGTTEWVFNTLESVPKLPLVRVKRVGMREASAACTGMLQAVSDKRLVHAKDTALDSAVESATIRIRTNNRLFGRKTQHDHIEALEACALALHKLEGSIERAKVRIAPQML